MSGLAGIWHRDRQPIDPSSVSRMLDHLAHRGPDGRASWHDTQLALGCVSTRVVPEAGPAPIVDGSGRAFSFDGRIDNREELSAALERCGHPPRTHADAEVAFQACVAWGQDAPARLLGDFAFVFWNAPSRTLMCARDVRGIRPLCYRVDGARVAWASEAHALVRPPFDQPPPNEELVAEYLTAILTGTSQTLFEGVFRLPPATVLVATPERIRLDEYWHVDPSREIRYATDAEYDEEYVTLLRAAVECRLRSTTDIGILLSGGLDSSVVTGAAVAACGPERFHTFSLSCPGDVSDERPFVDVVTAKWGLQERATIVAEPEAAPFESDVRRYRDLPSYPNAARSEALFDIARRRNVRLILTGLGGDEWFAGHAAHTADALAAGRPLRALRQMRCDVRSGAVPGWRYALWNAARPLVPEWALATGRRVAGHSVVPEWIRPSFAARVALADRLYSQPRRFGFATRAQDELFREAVAPFTTHALEMFDRTVSSFGLEAAHPLEDRRLLEFGVALPESQRWAGGRPKTIVRRAGASLLPEVVAQRIGSPDYLHAFEFAFAHLGARARLARPSGMFDAWVDREALLSSYDRIVATKGANDWSIWMATAVRLWVDAVFEEGNTNASETAA